MLTPIECRCDNIYAFFLFFFFLYARRTGSRFYSADKLSNIRFHETFVIWHFDRALVKVNKKMAFEKSVQCLNRKVSFWNELNMKQWHRNEMQDACSNSNNRKMGSFSEKVWKKRVSLRPEQRLSKTECDWTKMCPFTNDSIFKCIPINNEPNYVQLNRLHFTILLASHTHTHTTPLHISVTIIAGISFC